MFFAETLNVGGDSNWWMSYAAVAMGMFSVAYSLRFISIFFGKPADAADACRILARLSGRSHRVLTAIALADGDGERIRSALSVSEVRFRSLTEDEIRRYVATGEPMDKAGAYGIQGRAAMFIEEIRGSYTGIMGLPLYETSELLAAFGYPLWSQSAAP